MIEKIKDNISLNHLTHIIVSIQQYSYRIVDYIVTQYQKDFLNVIFADDTPNRNKVNLVT